jgi:hypothetical protein
MAYKDFTLERLENDFGIKNHRKELFKNVTKVEHSDDLTRILERNRVIPAKSEKARSELIIMPIITEVTILNQEVCSVFSGERFDVDKKAGLVGECDYLFAKVPHSMIIKNPVIALVEAKRQIIEQHYGQCAAQMYGAQQYNIAKNNPIPDAIYGCITTGEDWQFMKLQEKTLFIDTTLYFRSDLPQLLGVFQHIINQK